MKFSCYSGHVNQYVFKELLLWSFQLRISKLVKSLMVSDKVTVISLEDEGTQRKSRKLLGSLFIIASTSSLWKSGHGSLALEELEPVIWVESFERRGKEVANKGNLIEEYRLIGTSNEVLYLPKSQLGTF